MKRPNKKIMLILSIFLVFLVMGAASAADDDSVNQDDEVLAVEDTASEEVVSTADTTDENTDELADNNTAGSYTEQEILTQGEGDSNVLTDGEDATFDDLNSIFNKGKGTFYLGGKTYKGNGTAAQIPSSAYGGGYKVNIYGGTTENPYAYSTLDAQKLSNVLNINNGGKRGTFTFYNVKFTNGNKALDLPAITLYLYNCEISNNNQGIFSTYANVYLTNCTLINNTNGGRGGAVYVHTSTKGEFINCTFINNSASEGGAVSFWSESTGKVINCHFYNNSGSDGGSLSIIGDVQVENSTFNNGNASKGADIHVRTNNININKCNFTDSYTTYAGAICMNINCNNTCISNSIFTNCFARDDGGSAIVTMGTAQAISVINCTFNQCNNYGVRLTGGYNQTLVQGCEFNASSLATTSNSEGICIDSCNFNNIDSGEGLLIRGIGINITSTNVTGNNMNGTGIIINSDSAYVQNVNVTGTESGIVINGDNVTIEDSSVTDCDYAGIIINGDGSTVENNEVIGSMIDILVDENSDSNTEDNIKKLSEQNQVAAILRTNGLNIVVNPSIIHVDENITVTVHMASGAGTVRVTLNGINYNLTEDGIVDFGVLSVGDYNITVEFTENIGFTSEDTKIISIPVKYWDFTELQQLIDNPDENGTVNLGNHTFIQQEGESPITISGDIVVNGEGSTIDANGADNALTINGNNTIINDLTINNVNGTAISGSGDNIKINSVTVNDSNGTAIDITGKDTTISDVELNNVENGIKINGTGNASIKDVIINNANGKAVDVVADNVNIENSNLTNVNKGMDVTATTGDAKVDNVVVDGADSDAIVVKAENGTATVTDSEVKNVNGTAITATGKEATVADTNMSNVDKGMDVTATTGDAKVDNVVVDGADSDAIVVKAENGTATVTDSEVKNVNGTAITATGKEATVTDTNLTNVQDGVKVDAENTANVDNIAVTGGNGTAVDVKAETANVGDLTLNNSTGTAVKANATNKNIKNVVDNSGTMNAGDATNMTVHNKVMDPDKAFTIPATSSKTPVFTIEMPSDATGDLVVKADGKEVGRQTLKDGKASVTVSGLSAGAHNVEVSYTGDSKYAPISKTGSVTIPQDTTPAPVVVKKTVKLTAKSVKKSYKKTSLKKIQIKAKALKNLKVKITLKVNKKLKGKIGKKLKKGYVFKNVKFNKKGIAYIKLTKKQVKGFNKGTYKFKVTFKGNTQFKGASKKIKMKIK